MRNQPILNHIALGMLILTAGILLNGCGTSSNNSLYKSFSFNYEVPDNIENAWIITHTIDGDVIDSKEVSGTGQISIQGVDDGLLTLFTIDTGIDFDYSIIKTYPLQAAQNKILELSTYPWLKPEDQQNITFQITCPTGASRIAVRGNLVAWWEDCNVEDDGILTLEVYSNALARRSDGKLGAVLWAFDEEGPIAYVLVEEFNPDTTVVVRAADWRTDFLQSELHVIYANSTEAEKHRLGYTILAETNGGWYDLDTPGSYNTTTLENEIVLTEAYAPLSSVNQAILWAWSQATITPDVEGATSIRVERSTGIPGSLQFNFLEDFAPYPDYIEWDYDSRGRIWVKTHVNAPSTPTYYYAIVRSDKGNTHREWSMVLLGDHRDGAIFPELPPQLLEYVPTKQDVDKALVGNDIGTVQWLTFKTDPTSSFSGDTAWYVWRWKYVVGP